MAKQYEKTDGRSFVSSMRKAAQNRKRKRRDIDPDTCIRNIEWASAGMRNELLHGGQYLIYKGQYLKDEKGKRIFIYEPSMIKLRGYQMFAEVQFKMLKKVMPDAQAPLQIGASDDLAQLFSKLVENLPD